MRNEKSEMRNIVQVSENKTGLSFCNERSRYSTESNEK